MTEDPGNAGKETDECLTRCYLIASVQSYGAQRNASLNNNRQVRALFENQIIRTPLYQIYRKVRMPNRLFNLISKTTWDFNSKKSRRHVDIGLSPNTIRSVPNQWRLDACGLLATTCLLSPTQWKFRFSKSKHV
ncbi:hypothetical protein D8674_041878 [Pyrus ussuriensis x Pyrus communis]|uniref:Uncharacterized protein n=1 Tax=Pyrus ussuriensis x Pyrus communis TaxID=2448454 RepID=A0A5N5H0P8_9ROSA|nr:hypothetical protein D8674_041878 [Pyrus ussuriensis x Pyrus communis]